MTGKYLSLGCLLLLSAAGPCWYYYFEGHPRAKEALSSEHVAAPRCKSPVQSNLTLEKSGSWMWRQVDPHSKWYINSVYLDRRLNPPLIRMVAMSRETEERDLFCQMWSNYEMTEAVKVRQQELWIHAWDLAEPGLYYQPYLLSCPISHKLKDLTAVSITVGDPCASPAYRLQVPPMYRGNQREFVVCLKPLHFESDVSLRLIEWLELQFLLGADNVFVYVKQIHPRMWSVLKHYEKWGQLMLVNHTVPGVDVTGLWQKRRHEIAAYNDCLYRHVETHRFVVNIDLDEAIVPVTQDSWHQLLVNHSNSASVSVRCVYFFDELGEEASIPQHLHMLRHIYRSAQFTPPGFAQKSFFTTKNAEAVTNHFALRAVHPNVRLLSGLGVQEARLHHYRKECPPMMASECERNYMKFWKRDTLLWKYKDRLQKNIRQRIKELYS